MTKEWKPEGCEYRRIGYGPPGISGRTMWLCKVRTDIGYCTNGHCPKDDPDQHLKEAEAYARDWRDKYTSEVIKHGDANARIKELEEQLKDADRKWWKASTDSDRRWSTDVTDLQQALFDARAERDRLSDRNSHWCAENGHMEEQVKALTAERDKLKAIQARWVRHATACAVYTPHTNECDCGLTAALDAPAEEEK